MSTFYKYASTKLVIVISMQDILSHVGLCARNPWSIINVNSINFPQQNTIKLFLKFVTSIRTKPSSLRYACVRIKLRLHIKDVSKNVLHVFFQRLRSWFLMPQAALVAFGSKFWKGNKLRAQVWGGSSSLRLKVERKVSRMNTEVGGKFSNPSSFQMLWKLLNT